MPQYSKDEVIQKGREIYQAELQASVETENKGKFLVLDIDSRDYEIDSNELAAITRSMEKHPDGSRYIMRVGYPAAHRIALYN